MITKIIEILLRILFAFLAIYTGYEIVTSFIEPEILKRNCLTEANGCFHLKMYKYKNSFIAQESTTKLWMWFNGLNFYLYGLAPGNCKQKQNFEPAFRIEVDTSKGYPRFLTDRIQCVTKREQVLNYYITNYKVKEEIIYLRPPKTVIDLQDILTEMYYKNLIA